jgi:hypothetical protein
VGIRCADHATPYPQKLALTSPTCGGRSVGIVRSRTKAAEFSFERFEMWRETVDTVDGEAEREREYIATGETNRNVCS